MEINIMKSEINLLDLPVEILDHVANFLSREHLISFGLTSKKCWQIFQLIDVRCIDLRKCFRLDEKKMLDKARTRKYTSVNVNGCHWLTSGAILELISKEGVRELKVIDCRCTSEVIKAVAKLNLTSLSISLTKEWMFFFVSNELNSIPCFMSLKRLKIYQFKNYSGELGDLVNHVSRYVLRHCHKLEYLKLFNHSPAHNTLSRPKNSETPKIVIEVPTPVPKLECLILDFQTYDDDISQEIDHLLRLILHQKENPLKRVYLGKQTAKAISNGIFFGKNISFEKTTVFCLSSVNSFPNIFNNSLSKLLKTDGCESMIDSMLKSWNCKGISIEDTNLDDLPELTKALVESGNTSIEQINFRGCRLCVNICSFIDVISNLCLGITFLDVSVTLWINNDDHNSTLMNSIANLKNLRTLYMTPAMLSVDRLSFYKMAKSCKLIENLRIVNFANICTVCSSVLAVVKYFENLLELHLVKFSLTGNKPALAQITASCARLESLFINRFYHKEHVENIAECLAHAKQLKHLSISQNLNITTKFVDNLTRCSKLEKLYVHSFIDDDCPIDENNKYFADNLKKLTNLRVLVIISTTGFLRVFASAINGIEEAKRPFFYPTYVYVVPNLPLAHQHMAQYVLHGYCLSGCNSYRD